MEQHPQGIAPPKNPADPQHPQASGQVAADAATKVQADRQWVDPAIYTKTCDSAVDMSSMLTNTVSDTSMGLAKVERRLSERAEQLWKKLAGDAVMPDSSHMAELLRPPFLGNLLLVETSGANFADGKARIAFIGEALLEVTGLQSDMSADPETAGNPFGACLLRIAAEAAQIGAPCRYENDLSAVKAAKGDTQDQILTRAIAMPFAPLPQGTARFSIVVVAAWRQLLSAEETRVLHRELAAAIDWLQKQQES